MLKPVAIARKRHRGAIFLPEENDVLSQKRFGLQHAPDIFSQGHNLPAISQKHRLPANPSFGLLKYGRLNAAMPCQSSNGLYKPD